MNPTPSTLFATCLDRAPPDKIAIILPEQNIRITYGALRGQVQAVAEQLAAAGVGRGDRVGIALPNGLPMIVSFLAASMAGTAAPLNPGVQGRRVPLLSRGHQRRKVLILPPDGADEARARRRRSRADPRRSTWTQRARSACSGVDRPRQPVAAAGGRRRRAGAAHERQHRPARSACRSRTRNLSISAQQRRAQLRARPPTTCRCA